MPSCNVCGPDWKPCSLSAVLGSCAHAGEDEHKQLACIMDVLGPPPRSMLDAAPRAHLFFQKITGELAGSA